MYVPKSFEETRLDVLHRLMKAHPFAAFVISAESELVVNHIPFITDSANGEFGTLRGHVARANPVWQYLSRDSKTVVIFQGPEAYITPSWYPSKQTDGRVVPTWNY